MVNSVLQNLSKAVVTIAPTLSTMLLGPLAGTAVTALENAFGLVGTGPDAVTEAIQSGKMTPEIIASMRTADQKHQEIMGQQGIDILKINKDAEIATTQATLDDISDARKSNSGRDAVWYLASVVLGTFACLMMVVLYGCWSLISGGIILRDPSVVAAISGLVGSVVGYVASNAQTVINFIYGGSLGSEKKTDALSNSIQQAIGSLK